MCVNVLNVVHVCRVSVVSRYTCTFRSMELRLNAEECRSASNLSAKVHTYINYCTDNNDGEKVLKRTKVRSNTRDARRITKGEREETQHRGRTNLVLLLGLQRFVTLYALRFTLRALRISFRRALGGMTIAVIFSLSQRNFAGTLSVFLTYLVRHR